MSFMQIMPCAFVFALANAGKSKPARIAIMAITTSNSINVKPPRRHNFRDLPGILMVFISKLFFGDLINKITNHRKLSEFSGGRRNGQLCVPAHRDFLTVGVRPDAVGSSISRTERGQPCPRGSIISPQYRADKAVRAPSRISRGDVLHEPRFPLLHEESHFPARTRAK